MRHLPRLICIPILVSSGLWAEECPNLIQRTGRDGLSLVTSPARFEKEDWGSLLGAAGLLGTSVALDRIVFRNLSPHSDSNSAQDLRHFGDVAQYSGLILGGGFFAQGWMEKDEKSKRTAEWLVESFAWSSGFAQAFKYSVGRERPSETDDPFQFKLGRSGGSFPSGHTTAAFSAATVLSEQYPTWKVAVPSYAVATAVGFSRLYANQHWLSDTVAGALLGSGVAYGLGKFYSKPDACWSVALSPGNISFIRRFS